MRPQPSEATWLLHLSSRTVEQLLWMDEEIHAEIARKKQGGVAKHD